MGKSIADIISEQIRSNRAELPVFQGTVTRLNQIVSCPDFDVDEVEKVIGNDPVLSAAVLRSANSSFYSSLEKVTSTQEAIMRLGVKRIVNLATMVSLKPHYRLKTKQLRPLVDALWLHSVSCAAGAEWLAVRTRNQRLSAEAFMAGMLHDIGRMLVLRVLDDLMQQHRDFEVSDGLVREIMDEMHVACGEELMRVWNMPELYVDVVRRHHAEGLRDDDVLLATVRLVDLASNKLGMGVQPPNDSNLAATSEAHLLQVSEIVAAELEIALEDSLQLAGSA